MQFTVWYRCFNAMKLRQQRIGINPCLGFDVLVRSRRTGANEKASPSPRSASSCWIALRRGSIATLKGS